jgi:hypothetical protein
VADDLCKTWVLSWDQTGLESVVMVYDPQWLLDSIATGKPPSVSHVVSAMMMRARYNSQRHYELYAINFDYDMTESEIREFYNQGPQAFVDLIRERGHKLYSDRMQEDKILIR